MFLLIDKQRGMTSHDVVDRIRKISGVKTVGHAGTLDPNATGLLIIGVGRESTKKLSEISKNTKKEYEAEICLGEERDTDDIEGKVIARNEEIIPTIDRVKEVLMDLKGEIEQIPPSYSAIKVRGVNSYRLARKGIEVNLGSRKVTVYSIKLLKYEYPILKIECLVSSGTYIRSLARDIGKKLGCGGYLKNLRRTKIGKYLVNNAMQLEDLNKAKLDL